MLKKQIKLSILMTFMLTILICTSAFASSTYTRLSEANSDVSQIDFVSNRLTKTGDTTATFKYKILNKAGIDITQTIPASQISAASSVSSSISLDPLTGTGTITFISFPDTSKSIIVTLMVSGITVTRSLTIDNSAIPIGTSDVSQIDFISNQLTKTGDTTATFKYKILNKAAIDITQTIPASQIFTVASVSSSISLNPLTRTGTITFKSSSDTSKSVIVTLVDQVSGIIVSGSLSIHNTVTEKIAKISIPSPKLIYEHKIYDNDEAYGVTAYEVYDQAGNNITNYSVARNLTFQSSVGTVTGRNGLIKLTGVDFAQLGTFVITVTDPTTGISTNSKLTVVDSWSKAATE